MSDRLREIAREACLRMNHRGGAFCEDCEVILSALEQAQEEYRLNTTVWTHASPVSKEGGCCCHSHGGVGFRCLQCPQHGCPPPHAEAKHE